VTASPERLAQLIEAIRPSPWVADLFDKQRDVLRSKARFKSVTTSRRGGKTIMLTALAADSLDASGFDEVTLYIARTRIGAKELIWSKLKGLARRYQLPWSFHESELRIETPAGGVLLVRGAEGADPEEEREKIRGLKVRRALLDEPDTYAGTMRVLLREVIEPALGDLRGDVIIAGTPGDVPAGAWFEISEAKIAKWTRFHWTIRDNPHFKDSAEYLTQVLADNHWSEDHPTYQREYLGKWSQDDSKQVYRYVQSYDVDAVPGYVAGEWVHTIGVDFGQTDSCAWVVLASHPHRSETYVVDVHKKAGLTPEQAADITRGYVTKYNPHVLVGDGGNLGGNIYIDAYNQRHYQGVAMVAATKSEKRAYIELLNGDLRATRLRFLKPQCEPLTDELLTLPWSDETRTHPHASYDDHAADAFLYSWRHHTAYLHSAPTKNTPTVHLTPDDDKYVEREEDEAREAAGREWWDA
jgi:hypothetical protein